jgi:hypothetical protein
MKNLTKLALALVMVLTFQTMLLAADKSITVSASVPALTGIMEVKIMELKAVDALDPKKDWDTATEVSSIDFGSLARDATYKIFTATKYFAVEVSVLDNTGKSWTLTHSANSVKYQTEKLDESINVSFAKVMLPRGNKPTDTVESILSRGNYLSSNNAQYNRATLEGGKGGWLRIYYGIATGNADSAKGTVDPAGSFPIAQYQQAGMYVGGVTLTLAQQ